jgi:hypothetical protein
MNFTELAEEAWERAGREMRSGYDLRTARRSLNLLTIEINNRGLNLWTLAEGTLNLVAGTATYSLPADTVDILEHVLRTDAGEETLQNDVPLSRISVSTYSTIPNKLSQARPLQLVVNRLATPTVTLWPVPDDATTYQIIYWRMRRIEDAGTGINTQDIVYRFYPALVAGLAYYIAMKVPELAPRLDMLKMAYEEQFDLAAGEDREKAPQRWVPRRMYIGRAS